MDRDALEAWIADGLSLEQIGQRTGRHASTVAYWLNKHGLKPAHRARHAARGAIPRETLETLVARHLTIREIAAEVDRSIGTVRYWLGRYGIAAERAYGVPRGTPGEAGAIVRGECPDHGWGEYIRRRDGAWRCMRCRSAMVSRRRRRLKEILVAQAGGACILCGYSRYAGALEFHHVDPAEKSFTLARAGVSRSLERAREEAAKCVLLCSNCHAEVEGGVAVVPAKLRPRAADYPG